MLDTKAPHYIFPLIHPVGRRLADLGVPPGAVTLAGLAITGLGSLLVAGGSSLAGAALVGVGSSLDALDGAVARASARASERGAILDSCSDRLGETFMWAGLAYQLSGRPEWVGLCVLSLGFSVLISYLRSKAEAAGLDGRGGWMARPERVLLYVIGVGSGHIVPMLWIMTSLTAATAAGRFYRLWSRLPR
jgi:CDP-diacylglycerol--glycerol-3-phosphate 3-phosphatidyltransferase